MDNSIIGGIYHPKNLSDSILKCSDPLIGETWKKEGIAIPIYLFHLTNEFPNPQYIVIDRLIKNLLYPDYTYYQVYLMTNSSFINNIKIEGRHFNHSKLDLKQSFITNDIFLIHHHNIDFSKSYGNLELNEIYKDSNKF